MEVGIMDTIITDQQALDILTAMSDAVANNPELDDASPERISGFALEFVVNEVARLRDESLTFDPNLFELAKIILSDCGISENNQQLYDRVLSRLINARLPITTPTEQQILTATEKAGMWPNNVRKWIPVFHRYHAELAAMSYNQVGNSAILEQAIELLKKAELEIDRHICPHDSTHRGGAIWEICDDCGAKWADDRGGKPEFKPNEVSEAIREFINAHSVGIAEPCTNSDVWNCKYCRKTESCKAIDDPRNFTGTVKPTDITESDLPKVTIPPLAKKEPIQVMPTSKNEYGLDVSYFGEKLLSILRDIGNCKPDEMYRQLNYLISVVTPAQLTEPEFDYTDVRLAELIMSDCGVSTVNSQSLVERIAGRISKHAATQLAMQVDVNKLKQVINELRAYIPEADEYKGEHIHKVWAKEIETALLSNDHQSVEIESLHSVYQGMLKESQASIDALQSELAAAKKNQDRYLWIRNESWAQYNMHKGKPHLVTFNAIGRPTHLAEDAVDEEIDKAILEEAKR